MKKHIHIVVVESSDILFEGLSSILYSSSEEFMVTRMISFEEVECMLTNKSVDILFINPMIIFNHDREIKKLRKLYPSLLITCVNMNILDSGTLLLYDFTMNIYDCSTDIL